MNRKSFLRGVGLGTIGALAGPSLGCATTDNAIDTIVALPDYSATNDADFWNAVRQQYVLEPDLHYMNTGGLGPAAKPVLKVFADVTPALCHVFVGGLKPGSGDQGARWNLGVSVPHVERGDVDPLDGSPR